MSVVVTKLAEIALINLCYAEADLTAEGENADRLERIRQHIHEAEACLKIIAPDFTGESPDPENADEIAA